MLCSRRKFAFSGLRNFSSTTPSETLRPVILRPYQERCIDACAKALDSGTSRIGVSLPTGSGKTNVFISLLPRIAPPSSNPEAIRSLIIVNSIEIARQTARHVASLFPRWTVQIEQGTKHRASGLADVTIATYQTLRQAERISKFNPRFLKAIIVDEAHHAAAPSYRRLLSHFNPDIQNPDSDFKAPTLPHTIPIIGFSATFSRHDGLALGSVFERIVYHRHFLEMIKDQWLCNVRFTSVRANMNLKNVTINSRTGDFNSTSLVQVVNTETINKLVVQTWLERAVTRKSTIVFCVNVAHVEALTRSFRSFGIDARCLHSKSASAERKDLIASFKAGRFPVLVNCAILTEGADIPNIDCVIIARPTRSRNLFAQMIGRGMRLSPDSGKEDCRIIDFVDSANRVSDVVSTPTLFGLDPREVDISDETTETLEKRVAETVAFNSTDDIPEPKSVTYTDYDDPFSFIDRASGAPHIATLSNYAWVGCGDNVYVLECLNRGHIRIEPVEGETDCAEHFQAYFSPAAIDKGTTSTLKVCPYLRSRKVLTAENLSDAVRGCDTYAKAKVVFGPMALGLLRSARWRNTPASEQQKRLIAKRWGMRGSISVGDISEDDKAQRIANLTKGEACNIITRLKHGALSRYEKKKRAATYATKILLKEKFQRAAQEVRVGPLPRPM